MMEGGKETVLFEGRGFITPTDWVPQEEEEAAGGGQGQQWRKGGRGVRAAGILILKI